MAAVNIDLAELLPIDPAAERRLTAIAVLSQRGADLSCDHGIAPGHFHDPHLARIYTAARACLEYGIDERKTAIATAGFDMLELEALEQLPRTAITDEHGHYARRVLEAATARSRILELLDALEELTGLPLAVTGPAELIEAPA